MLVVNAGLRYRKLQIVAVVGFGAGRAREKAPARTARRRTRPSHVRMLARSVSSRAGRTIVHMEIGEPIFKTATQTDTATPELRAS